MSGEIDTALLGEPQLGLRERKKAASREAIERAAEVLLRANGYEATSMDDIARGAGVSRKTLFNYVSTKESLVYALIDRFIDDHMPDWLESETPHFHDVRDILTPATPERVQALARCRWLLTIAAQHTRFFSGDGTPFISTTLRANLDSRARRIAAVQAEGGIRADVPALEISRYYEVLRDHVLRTWLLEPDSTDDQLTVRFEHAMAVLMHGLRP